MGEQTAGGKTKDAKFNFGPKGWALVIMGFLAYLVYMSFDNGLNYIVPAYSASLQANPTTLFLFSSIGGWVGVVGLIVFGALRQKIGIKTTTLIAMGLFTAATIGWIFAPTVGIYAICAILVKSMGCVVAQYCFSEFGANWFPTKKGNYMGVITIGVVFGGFMGNMVIGVISMSKGIQTALAIMAIISVIVFILFCIILKDNPEDAGAFPDNDKNMTPEMAKAILAKGKAYEKASPWTIGKCLKTPAVWLCALSFGLLLLVAQGTMAQVTLISNSFGYSEQIALMVNLVGAPIAIAATLLAGVLDQKAGTKKASIVCILFSVVGCLVVGLLGGKAPVAMFIGVWLVFASCSGGNNMIMSMTATLWGRFDFSKPYLCILTIATIIDSFGYVILSALADAFGGYGPALIVCAGISIVSLILMLVLKDKYIGSTEEEMDAIIKSIG